jgi:hypothetical protein
MLATSKEEMTGHLIKTFHFTNGKFVNKRNSTLCLGGFLLHDGGPLCDFWVQAQCPWADDLQA